MPVAHQMDRRARFLALAHLNVMVVAIEFDADGAVQVDGDLCRRN
jgi:hypothetical protein